VDHQVSASTRRYGGFDVLRILAALAVVLSHSYSVTGHPESKLSFSVGHFAVPLGALGVSIFFVTSGFLVAGSWDRLANVGVFALHRFARIWPAIVVVITLTVFVMGPLVTSVGLHKYFISTTTMFYFVRNVVLFGGTVNKLPGVFTTHPDISVNGSIWTLTYEVWAYAAIVGLGILGALRRWWTPTLVLVALLGLLRFGVYDKIGGLPTTRPILGLTLADGAKLWSFFFAGVVLSRVVKRVDPAKLIVPGVAAVSLSFALGEPTLYIVGLAGCVIGFGSLRGRVTEAVHALGDPSYGIYILAFPIQQLIYGADIARTPWPMFAVAGAISIAGGYLSWHALERPVLDWAKRRPKTLATK